MVSIVQSPLYTYTHHSHIEYHLKNSLKKHQPLYPRSEGSANGRGKEPQRINLEKKKKKHPHLGKSCHQALLHRIP